MGASNREFEAQRKAMQAAREQSHTCDRCGTTWTTDGPSDFRFCSFKCWNADRQPQTWCASCRAGTCNAH
jgi:hypothetical protein